MEIDFTVPGTPFGKGRARIIKIAGHSRMATPTKTANYEGLVAHTCQAAMAGREPTQCAVSVALYIALPVPASWSKKKQAQALAGQLVPTAKPDIDNVVKAIFDGLNGVAWRDDVLAADVSVRKRYAATPGVRIRIKDIADANGLLLEVA